MATRRPRRPPAAATIIAAVTISIVAVTTTAAHLAGTKNAVKDKSGKVPSRYVTALGVTLTLMYAFCFRLFAGKIPLTVPA